MCISSTLSISIPRSNLLCIRPPAEKPYDSLFSRCRYYRHCFLPYLLASDDVNPGAMFCCESADRCFLENTFYDSLLALRSYHFPTPHHISGVNATAISQYTSQKLPFRPVTKIPAISKAAAIRHAATHFLNCWALLTATPSEAEPENFLSKAWIILRPKTIEKAI